MINAKAAFKANILSRTRDRKFDDVRKKYEKNESEYSRASQLFEQFRDAGVAWEACLFAVKTDWVSQFTEKWGARMSLLKQEAKK